MLMTLKCHLRHNLIFDKQQDASNSIIIFQNHAKKNQWYL